MAAAGGRGRAKRRLGQNFLRARWVARRFASWACGRRVLVEVGAGTGFLTRHVLSECRPELLVAVEIDPDLLPELGLLSWGSLGLAVVHSDALHPPVDLSRVEGLYGSIPYNITGPLLGLVAVEYGGPAMLLLQREVVDRLSARPGSSAYGRISVLVQLVYRVKPGPVVPPSAFNPRPRVYSRLVELEPLEERPPRHLLRRVEELTRCMFALRNKKAAKAARRCGVEPPGWLGERRVYQLEPGEFLQLAAGGEPGGGVEA
ncbi:MAG: ribosomal RNA small subunit methyltransferase A [Crenarchaeota archaeon]|nr:ribosomal RNA small subunit methyltransferase A [Thermoproteota archaeon]